MYMMCCLTYYFLFIIDISFTIVFEYGWIDDKKYKILKDEIIKEGVRKILVDI